MRPALYLASTSRYRAAQLARLGQPFLIEAPQVDESAVAGEAPAARALRLAHAKALAVSARHPEAWVLGSDQVADCAGRIHDKPGDAARCREQLRASSGRTVQFHTAVVLRRGRPDAVREHLDRTIVRFRELGDDEITRYVARDQPFDCAGGFRCEGLGVALFDTVETRDPFALVGLPLIWVAKALREVGLDPLAPAQL
jgi:septum formation protein